MLRNEQKKTNMSTLWYTFVLYETITVADLV